MSKYPSGERIDPNLGAIIEHLTFVPITAEIAPGVQPGKMAFLENVFVGEQEALDKQYCSPTLLESPRPALEELTFAQEGSLYIEALDSEDKTSVDSLVQQFSPPDSRPPRVSVCIAVAAHEEGRRLYHTLQRYTQQSMATDGFEVVLFLNKPALNKDGTPTNDSETLRALHDFQADYPDSIQLQVLEATLNRAMKIGEIKKLLHDAVIMRHLQADTIDPILILNDADMIKVPTGYVENYVEYFAQEPHLEAAVHRFRTMTDEEAMHVLERYGVTDLKSKTKDIYSLLISFALFRKSFFVDKSFVKLFGQEKYDSVNEFDDRPFKELLRRIIDEGDDDARTQIAWFFWTLPKKGSDYEKDVDLSFEYLDMIADRYTREAINRVAYFIKDHLDDRPEQSLKLWEKITIKERDWLAKEAEKILRHQWWSHHNHPQFLNKMRELYGDDRYLDMVDILLGYPKDFQAMIAPDTIHTNLLTMNTERSDVTMEKLKSQYPYLYTKDVDSGD